MARRSIPVEDAWVRIDPVYRMCGGGQRAERSSSAALVISVHSCHRCICFNLLRGHRPHCDFSFIHHPRPQACEIRNAHHQPLPYFTAVKGGVRRGSLVHDTAKAKCALLRDGWGNIARILSVTIERSYVAGGGSTSPDKPLSPGRNFTERKWRSGRDSNPRPPA